MKMLNIFQIRSIVGLRRYSQDAKDRIYKFYSEGDNECDKYRTLDEQDYRRFLSKRTLSHKPATSLQLINKINSSKRKIKRHLAEGMPNEAMLPFTSLELATRGGGKITIGGEEFEIAMQYMAPKGLTCLIDELTRFQQELHRPPPLPRNLVVTNGAQHGIHLCAELLVDPGDPVIATKYSYTGLISILKPYQVEYIGIGEDKDGFIPDELEAVLNARLKQGLKMPKVIFLTPTISNPTGHLLSGERKYKIYEIACKYDLIIVEDEPYMFLNYTNRVIPSFLSMDTAGRVLRIDSFSKVVCAGLRTGWVTGPEPLGKHFEQATMSMMLHPCTLAQSIIYNLMIDRASLKSQILRAREFYKNQIDSINSALKKIEDLIEWEEPQGGYFHWLKIRDIDDVRNMVFRTAFDKGLLLEPGQFDKGLLLEPGQNFIYNSEMPSPYIRMTFSRVNLDELEDDVNAIRDIIQKERKLQRSYIKK